MPTKREIKHKAMSDFRWALKGYAFSTPSLALSKVNHAESLIAALPLEYQAEAKAQIADIRNTLDGAPQ